LRFHDTAYIEIKIADWFNRWLGVKFGVLEVVTEQIIVCWETMFFSLVKCACFAENSDTIVNRILWNESHFTRPKLYRHIEQIYTDTI
jgi:hypothetical protein